MKQYTISSETEKIRRPRHLAQPSILDIDTQLNSPKIKWIQRLLNPTNALWKDLMQYPVCNF